MYWCPPLPYKVRKAGRHCDLPLLPPIYRWKQCPSCRERRLLDSGTEQKALTTDHGLDSGGAMIMGEKKGFDIWSYAHPMPGDSEIPLAKDLIDDFSARLNYFIDAQAYHTRMGFPAFPVIFDFGGEYSIVAADYDIAGRKVAVDFRDLLYSTLWAYPGTLGNARRAGNIRSPKRLPQVFSRRKDHSALGLRNVISLLMCACFALMNDMLELRVLCACTASPTC
ncbi:hypothetical protein B0H14DRAFT_2674637 [Mycena olivaceomarginata]|nr:hypothetical protein B0H14DRAFT_2674637 [Mycena olivaceomarginata]